jgi:hypothetical protein
MASHYVRLTDNFALWEFLQSSVIPKLADYEPEPQEMANVTRLATHDQEIRDKFGRMKITGGCRPLSLRDSQGRTFAEALRVKGLPASDTSQHHHFCANDFWVPGDLWEVFNFVASLKSTNQCVLYLDDSGKPKFIHTSIHDFLNPEKGKRMPRLVHQNGKYEPWS